MLCSRCKKRVAVVFISSTKNTADTEGLCIQCAKEIGIKPLQDVMNKMGISEEDFSNMQEQFEDMINNEPENDDQKVEDGEYEEGETEFEAGGAATFPFVKNLFSNMLFHNKDASVNEAEKNSSKGDTSRQKKKSKR